MTLLGSGITSTMCFYREASKYLLEVLESVSETDLNDVIERILDAVEKQPCKYTPHLTKLLQTHYY